MSEPFADVLRATYGRVLAKTLAFTRSVPDAEDAVQEAIVRALETWPATGAPDSPEAWLLTVARNVHLDRARRSAREDLTGEPLELLAQMSPWVWIAVAEPEMVRAWKDDLLRLLFACCHPSLECGESAALALSTIIGMTTKEVSAAFLVAPRTMEQRLTRARKRLRQHGESEGASVDASIDRLDAVLQTIALLFNEGYWSTDDRAPIRTELCRLAIGLGNSLLEVFPDEPEVAGLLALMKLHDARRDARFNPRGAPIPLPEQDRSRWDRSAIVSATAMLDRALAAGKPGPFQIEAAISAIHCRAAAAHLTEWHAIADLYALLEGFRPTAAVRVNRAFAVGRAQSPDAGLALLDAAGAPDISNYPYMHLVRGALLEERGRYAEAREALLVARDRARNASEREQIERRLSALGSGSSVEVS
ncbi:MAG TPA: sigma-70 family RNA polymerase sigma factor [Vicinamibacterales bacterium]|nr:sigma-70 family RNA polymerase sigma factor [Vicinamibacterales bacterium]